MKLLKLYTGHFPPCVKAAALVVFIATPGSLLVLPLVAWWVTRKGHLFAPPGIRG